MKLLELFKGTGSVSKVAQPMGFDIVSLDFDEKYNPDIETDILDWDYEQFYEDIEWVPDMIWASPPCNTFSPLAYKFKERNTKTAEPYSDRAKNGTQILYRTLQIINFFKKKNPKLLFVIENPRGMMRMDKKMKKLHRDTTFYCLYDDIKRKPTDFFNNFPETLKLIQDKPPRGMKTRLIEYLTLEQRYAIPAKLVKHILDEFIIQYKGWDI